MKKVILVISIFYSCSSSNNTDEFKKSGSNNSNSNQNIKMDTCVNDFNLFAMIAALNEEEHTGRICYKKENSNIHIEIEKAIPNKNNLDPEVKSLIFEVIKKDDYFYFMYKTFEDDGTFYKHHYFVFRDHILSFTVESYYGQLSGYINKITPNKITSIVPPFEDSSEVNLDFDPELYLSQNKDSISEYLELSFDVGNNGFFKVERHFVETKELGIDETEVYEIPFYQSIGGKTYYSFFWDIFYGHLVNNNILLEEYKK
jgi:hypothetical protein